MIPSVLQGLRALVSSHPQPTVLGCTAEQGQGGATPGYAWSSVASRAWLSCQPIWQHCPVSSVLLLCLLQRSWGEETALISCPVLEVGQGFLGHLGGAARMMGILSCSVWEEGGELSLLWKRILQAAAVRRQELCYVAAIMVFYSCFSLPVPRACVRCCPQG